MPHLELHRYRYLHHLHPNWHQGRSALFWHTTTRTFGLALIGIFLPIYIFVEARSQLGASIRQAVVYVLIYFLIRTSTALITDIPLGKLVKFLRFRYAMEIGNLFLLARILCWFLAQNSFSWLWLASIFGGLMVPLYWQSYHTLVSEEAGRKVGKTVSYLSILGRLSGAVGPLVGGIVITQLGWGSLFLFVFIVIILSGIPLLFMPHHPHKETINWQHLLSQLHHPHYQQRAIAFLGSGIENILQISWPLWLFIIIGSFEVLGIIASITLVISIFALLQIGKLIDQFGSRKILTFGSIINSIVWWLKLGALDLSTAFGIDLFNNLANSTYATSLDSTVYSLAATRKHQEFILFREVTYHLGSVIGILLSIIFIHILPNFWWGLFVLAALGSFLSLNLSSSSPKNPINHIKN